jgi:hypothetical protein
MINGMTPTDATARRKAFKIGGIERLNRRG